MMASKIELKAQLAAAETARDMFERDAEYLRKREQRRTAREYAERQSKLKQAERAERLKRLEHLDVGLLPLEGATQWAIVHEEGSKPGVEVFVPLSNVELGKVQEYLSGRDKPKPALTLTGGWLDQMQARINGMHAHSRYTF